MAVFLGARFPITFFLDSVPLCGTFGKCPPLYSRAGQIHVSGFGRGELKLKEADRVYACIYVCPCVYGAHQHIWVFASEYVKLCGCECVCVRVSVRTFVCMCVSVHTTLWFLVSANEIYSKCISIPKAIGENT